MSVTRGWWVDNRGRSLAHFYREDDLIPECEILAVWPLCGVEPPKDHDPREYLHLPDPEDADESTHPHPHSSMPNAAGPPCPACLARLAAPEGAKEVAR